MKDGIHEGKDGHVFWTLNGVLHRDDGPAVILANVREEWYQHGLRHRDDGPAVIEHDECQLWYRNGHVHRDDGPAIIYKDGSKVWYQNGLQHRVGAPAYQDISGTEEWLQHGEMHRTDGPAAIYANDLTKEWWIFGIQISSNSMFQKMSGLSDEGMMMMVLAHGDVK